MKNKINKGKRERFHGRTCNPKESGLMNIM